GGYAYTLSAGAVRRTDVATGATTVLAGSASASACTDSTDPAAARFSGGYLNTQPGAMTTDGYFLYLNGNDGCGLRRVSLGTGATSTLVGGYYSHLAMGPDGWLYATAYSGNTIYRIDPVNGTVSTFASVAAPAYFSEIAVDATSVWASGGTACSYCTRNQLFRVSLADATVTLAQDYAPSFTALASAGDYLYAATATAVRRYTKDSGAWRTAAGTGSAGMADATGADAWFSSVAGLFADGGRLWVTDTGNRRLRALSPAPALPSAQPPAVGATVDLDPGAVTTVAGNGLDATVDGTGASASFRRLGGVVVVGGYAYTLSAGAVRRTDVATGATTVLAGSASASACTDSTDPAA
ncbi:MAG: hypothetical protein ACREJC_22410, partial [Tepidisphaeraceae bacterium]